MMKVTIKKAEGKRQNRYTEEKVDSYTVYKLCLIRKSILLMLCCP